MKKVFCVLLVGIIILSALPVFAAGPYSVVSEFNDGEKMGVEVVANSNYENDFVLIAALFKDKTVLDVKTYSKSVLEDGCTISFDAATGAEIKLFAWNSTEGMTPARDEYLYSLSYDEIIDLMKNVNDYWVKKNRNISTGTNPWDVAVFHTGNMQAYYMTGDETYRNHSQLWSEVNSYQSYNYPTGSTTFADNLCCFQTYIDLYNITRDEKYLEYVTEQVDYIKNSSSVSYWYWIDAFYMAGPIFTKMYKLTGDKSYLDKMYDMIKYTAETLNCYDEEVGLWYRDASFINSISENGEKVFWSRGDGWVFAAFARIIEDLPDSYEHKDYFVNIFCSMAAALKKTQCSEGAWHESLLDPDFNPTCEESGTGFFVYGLLWGINNGYLEENDYLDCALKGWKWLTEVSVQDDYSVGYVQHIGAQPSKYELTPYTTEDYAYANFVFAAGELAKYVGGLQGDVLPYLQKKLLGNIEVYKKDSNYAIKNGEIVTGDKAYFTDDGILDGEKYTSVAEYIPRGMYAYEYEDLCIISEYITPFNKTEENLLKMLSETLSKGQFPERPYSDPDRIVTNKNEDRIENAEIPETTTKPAANKKITLTKSDVTASYIAQEMNGPENVIDKNLSTYCALEVADANSPEYLEFNLGEECEINTIGMSLFRGDIRTSWFSVEVSTDGVNYEEVIPVSSTPIKTTGVVYYPIEAVNAKYVRLYGYGNDNSTLQMWFSPSEIEIYQTTANPDSDEIDINNFTKVDYVASLSNIFQESNGPDNLNDSNFYSYCTVFSENQSAPEYIQLDLEEITYVDYLALAFVNGAYRKSMFYVAVSEDGENYKEVLPYTESSGTTNDYEYFKIGANAKYIRIYGYGNSYSNWFSVTEAAVLTAK
ncbi:MAG: glycoside hydrolase family 88 protein [Clostridia bacterium]